MSNCFITVAAPLISVFLNGITHSCRAIISSSVNSGGMASDLKFVVGVYQARYPLKAPPPTPCSYDQVKEFIKGRSLNADSSSSMKSLSQLQKTSILYRI